MAQGSIIWRCRVCGNKSAGSCKHPRAGYSIVFRVGNRQRWQSVGRNKKDAERCLTDTLSHLHQGTFREPQPVLFGAFAQQWLEDYARGAVKPLTWRSYRGLMRVHLIPAFGHLLLMQITPQDVQSFLARCLRDKGLSPKTVNHLLILFKTMLKHARQWGLLRENPTELVKLVRVEQQEMDFLQPQEIPLLLQHADEPYRTLFLLAALTGMRRGELLGLQWGDIDWHRNVIHVRRTLYSQTKAELAELRESPTDVWRFSTPKSKRSIRAIEMSPKVREALELHRLICPVSPDDLVFCSKEGRPIYAENMIRREFLPALSRAGIRRIRFHDLRHTYTTLLIAQGENVKFVQSQLGHASIETTLDRYGHLLPDTHRQVGERLDAQVFGGAEGFRANTVLTKHPETTPTTIRHHADTVQHISPNSHMHQSLAISGKDG